mgnify:CR=1 FL=1
MRLQAIYIKAFGGLKDYTLRFPAGACIYYGPNERGKTTVLHFIKALFYGLGDRRGQDNLRERFTPWDQSPMGGHIWFELGGTNYELMRTFGERKSLDQVSLTDLDHNQLVELENTEQPGAELFGLEEAVFMNSVFVDAAGPGLQGSEESRKALWENLADIMISPDDEVNAALLFERLSRAKYKLRSAGGGKGELPEAEKEIRRLEAEKESLETLYAQEIRLREEYEQWQQNLHSLKNEEENLRLRLTLQDLKEDEARLRMAEAPGMQKEALEAEQQQLETLLAPFGEPARAQRHALDKAEETLDTLQAEQHRTELAEENLRLRESVTEDQVRKSAYVLYILAVLLGIFGFLIEGLHVTRFLLITAGVLIVLASVLLGQRKKLARRRTAEDREETERLKAAFLNEKKRFELALESFGYKAGEAEGPDPKERFLKIRRSQWEDLRSLRRETERLDELHKLQAETLGGQDALTKRLEKLRLLLEDKGMDPEAAERLSPEETERLRGRLSDLQETIRRAERAAVESKTRLDSLLHDPGGAAVSPAEVLNDTEHQLDALQERYAEKTRRYQALETAEEHLRENLRELRENLLPKLAERAGFYMHKMSRGNYERVLIDDNLDLLLQSGGGGHYYPPERFSTGTEDQLYFAFRLALADYLSAGRKMPLLLDDALTHFDEKRAKEALWLLAERQIQPGEEAEDGEAEREQVLLFTCHKRLAKLAEKASWQRKTLP